MLALDGSADSRRVYQKRQSYEGGQREVEVNHL